MGLLGLERILDELKAALDAHMSAKLGALEAALTPQIPLEPLAEVAVGERENFTTYPAIALGPNWTDPRSDQGSTRLIQDHVLTLYLYVTDAQEGTLTRKLLRYTRAVAEVLAERRDAGAFGFNLVFTGRRWNYSPIAAGGHLFIRRAQLELRCWRAEDVP